MCRSLVEFIDCDVTKVLIFNWENSLNLLFIFCCRFCSSVRSSDQINLRQEKVTTQFVDEVPFVGIVAVRQQSSTITVWSARNHVFK